MNQKVSLREGRDILLDSKRRTVQINFEIKIMSRITHSECSERGSVQNTTISTYVYEVVSYRLNATDVLIYCSNNYMYKLFARCVILKCERKIDDTTLTNFVYHDLIM